MGNILYILRKNNETLLRNYLHIWHFLVLHFSFLDRMRFAELCSDKLAYVALRQPKVLIPVQTSQKLPKCLSYPVSMILYFFIAFVKGIYYFI